jgi:hypothetical protein
MTAMRVQPFGIAGSIEPAGGGECKRLLGETAGGHSLTSSVQTRKTCK